MTSPQFIGYAVDGHNSDLNAPVSAAATREEAMRLAITRVLSLKLLDSTIQVQDRTGVLSDEDFTKLTEHLDKYFAEKGIL